MQRPGFSNAVFSLSAIWCDIVLGVVYLYILDRNTYIEPPRQQLGLLARLTWSIFVGLSDAIFHLSSSWCNSSNNDRAPIVDGLADRHHRALVLALYLYIIHHVSSRSFWKADRTLLANCWPLSALTFQSRQPEIQWLSNRSNNNHQQQILLAGCCARLYCCFIPAEHHSPSRDILIHSLPLVVLVI